MRQFALTLGALLTSTAVLAATSAQDMGTTIKHAMQQPANSIQTPLIYGGRDIAKPLVATADEAVWSRQDLLVG